MSHPSVAAVNETANAILDKLTAMAALTWTDVCILIGADSHLVSEALQLLTSAGDLGVCTGHDEPEFFVSHPDACR